MSNNLPCFQEADAKRVIAALCEKHKIDITLLKDLCDVLTAYSGSGRREGMPAEITEAIDRFISRDGN